MYNKFSEDWVTTIDESSTDEEVVEAWATVATIGRVQAKEKTRRELGAPYTPAQLPAIPEESLFDPILDPLAEQPLDLARHIVPPSQQSIDEQEATPALDSSGATGERGRAEALGGVEEKADNAPAQDQDVPIDASLNDASPRVKTKTRHRAALRRPVTTAEQLESELWAARLGFCGWWQLAALPGKVDGIPATFNCHPFRFIDHKEAAAIKSSRRGRSHNA
jgi:hypothetical protein